MRCEEFPVFDLITGEPVWPIENCREFGAAEQHAPAAGERRRRVS
jgi:hypothetical protein